MKLDIDEQADITHPLPILDTFEVNVRFVNFDAREELADKCTVQKITRAGKTADFDFQKWLEHAPDYYIAADNGKPAWTGLTPSIVRRLGVPLKTDPPTDDTGCIPFDRELARQLWRKAQATKFRDPIVEFSGDMLDWIERAKEREKKDSASSS